MLLLANAILNASLHLRLSEDQKLYSFVLWSALMKKLRASSQISLFLQRSKELSLTR